MRIKSVFGKLGNFGAKMALKYFKFEHALYNMNIICSLLDKSYRKFRPNRKFDAIEIIYAILNVVISTLIGMKLAKIQREAAHRLIDDLRELVKRNMKRA